MQTKPAAKPPATSGQAAAKPQGEVKGAGSPEQPRQRAAMSIQRRLAIALASIIAVVNRPEVKKAITPADAEVIKGAQALASEANAKTLAPIDARLTALQTELAEATKPENLSKPDAVKTLKSLTQEMSRLTNRRKALVESANAS